MQNTNPIRYTITAVLLACYLLPVILLTVYSSLLIPPQERWQLLSIGLFGGLCGTLVIMMLLGRWEGHLRTIDFHHQDPSSPVEKILIDDEEITRLRQALSVSLETEEYCLKEVEQQRLAYQDLLKVKEELEQGHATLKENLEAQQEQFSALLQAKEAQLEENQQTLADQHALLEKRQKQIASLENTARDLKYELKTLIDLTDRIHMLHEPEDPYKIEPPSQAIPESNNATRMEHSPSTEPLVQLKRCIDIAQKLTGARHLTGHSPRFQDLSTEGYALDLRRLCDSLRSENSSAILLYSQKEEKVLFVNNQIKNLLGWSPEKFTQDFPNLITEGKEEWQATLRKLTGHNPNALSLTLKSKTGENKRLHVLLGLIPTGIFKTHVVGVVS